MTNQIQGEILFAGMPTSTFMYTPWMPVRANRATFAIEVLQIQSVTVTWNVETRKLEDPDTMTALASDQTTTALGVDVLEADDATQAMEELVRYRISTGTTVDATKWVVLRPLEPSWQFDR